MMKNFPRALFIGLLIGLLAVGISGGLVAGKKGSETGRISDKAKPQWKFTQVECAVAIDVHKNLNLFQSTLDPETYLNWNPAFTDSERTVATESNCPSGYVLSAYVSKTRPNGVNVLEDFEFGASKGTTNADPSQVSILLPDTWNWFQDTGSENSLAIGEVLESDVSGNFNKVNGTHWIMDYRYEMDSGDLPNVEYFVEMTFVVSAK